MPERHHVLQEEATPGDASAFAPVGLPTLESIFTRSGKLKGNAFRSASRLRVVLAALVSISAAVFLVFFCSRVYGRRALQDFRGRGLASSEDSDEEIDVCGFSSDEEEQQQHVGPRVSLPAAEEQHLPLKKRLLSRAGETVPRGVEPPPQQQEQQQQDDEVVAPLLRSSPPESPSGLEQFGSPLFPVSRPLSSAQVRTPPWLDAAGRMVNLGYQRDANEAFAFGAGQGVPMEVQHVQREALWMHSHEWQVPWLLPRQPQEQLQQQHDQPELYDPQQQLLFPQFGYWQQQHQRQFLREQLGQQQSLLLHQEPHHVELDQERQQALHQYDQQQPLQTQARLKRKRKEASEKQHADPRLGREEQRQQLQLSDPLADQWLAEEWIEPESSVSEMPQPSIPQQGSQYFAPAPEPGPSRSDQFSIRRILGLSAAPPAASDDVPAAAASRREAAETPAAEVAAAGAAAASPRIGPSSPARMAAEGGAISVETPTLSSLLTRATILGARAVTSGTGIDDSSASKSPSRMSVNELLGMPDCTAQAMREHPFARLPILKREGTARGLNVDLRRSVASQYGLRNAVPLLQEAHELLSREVLYPPEMRELAQAVGLLIAHSMHHESRDVSGLKPSHAVQYLGIRFLVLDVVVSAFLVLEQELEPAYWDLFADAVSHSTPPPPNRKSVAGRRDVSTRRVLALSRAIQTLKKGKRPEPRELIQLKRMLFCWKSSPRYFKSKAFDPWRHDDGCDGDEIGD